PRPAPNGRVRADLRPVVDLHPRVEGPLRGAEIDGDLALTAVERAELAGVAGLAGVGLALDRACHGSSSFCDALSGGDDLRLELFEAGDLADLLTDLARLTELRHRTLEADRVSLADDAELPVGLAVAVEVEVELVTEVHVLEVLAELPAADRGELDLALAAVDRTELAGVAGLSGVGLAGDRSC